MSYFLMYSYSFGVRYCIIVISLSFKIGGLFVEGSLSIIFVPFSFVYYKFSLGLIVFSSDTIRFYLSGIILSC